MVSLRTCALFVLTLLQLCRAEISDALPEWYSANVINNNFQPKSISEIFSTESSFSSTNPIIVLPKSSPVPDEMLLISSLEPLTRPVPVSTSTPSGNTKVSVTPLSPSTIPPTTPTQPPTTTPTLPSSPTPSPTLSASPTPSPTLPPTSVQTLPSSPASTEPPSSVQIQIQQTTPPVPQITLFERESTRPQDQLLQTQSQQVRIEVLPLGQVQPTANNPGQLPSQIGQFPSQIAYRPDITSQVSKEPQSNYFLIYQQAPQNIQGLPSVPAGPGRLQDTPNFMITAIPSTPSPPASPIPITNPVPTVQTIPAVSTQPPFILTSSQSIPSTIQTSPLIRLSNASTRNRNCPPQLLPVTKPTAKQIPDGVYPLSIRIVAPLGSIVNINPTKRPTTTTTKRTRKPKRNTYERCVDACGGQRNPICAIPLASTPINVDTLKGFPTICHMACHNSYRNQPYEKLSDGRCGRLRTRIQAVGSKSKITRNELKKAQYTIVGTGPQTIVEFSPLQ